MPDTYALVTFCCPRNLIAMLVVRPWSTLQLNAIFVVSSDTDSAEDCDCGKYGDLYFTYSMPPYNLDNHILI